MPADIKCPKCGSQMVVRTAQKGPNAGQSFHVCIMYPDCKGKVAIRERADKIPFHWWAGQQLASLLPFRKKSWIYGFKVCEWPVVMHTAKAAFFLGCSLAQANKQAAERILAEAATNQPWETEFSEAIQYLDRGRAQSEDEDTATFEDFYPELTSRKFKGVLIPQEECVGRVGQWVIPGLILGVLYTETASSMLKVWVSQERKVIGLGVRGLKVDSAPLLTSVEEARKQAQSLYETWQNEYGSGFSTTEMEGLGYKGQDPWLQAFMPLYKKATPLIKSVVEKSSDGLPADLETLIEAYRQLRPILESTKKLPKPKRKEFRRIQKAFEGTLSQCIAAGGMGVKMLDDFGHNAQTAARMRIAGIVGLTEQARLLYEVLCKELTPFV